METAHIKQIEEKVGPLLASLDKALEEIGLGDFKIHSVKLQHKSHWPVHPTDGCIDQSSGTVSANC